VFSSGATAVASPPINRPQIISIKIVEIGEPVSLGSTTLRL
jgi:hypothetical protein